MLGKVGLTLVGTVLAGVTVMASEGFVTVSVQEHRPGGHHIWIAAPGILGPVAAHFVPRQNRAEAAAQIEPWLPTIRAAMRGLEETEDATFVEVSGPDQYVNVQKIGGSIVVDVKDADETVHVSVPIRAAESTIEQLAKAAPNK
ncbi:MAG: hypothetical protein ACRD50_13680 [Candidatus Acidiferrales bacterium]